MKPMRLVAVFFISLFVIQIIGAARPKHHKEDEADEVDMRKKPKEDQDYYYDEEDEDELGEMFDCKDEKPCTCDATDNGTIKCVHVYFSEEGAHRGKDLTTANIQFSNLPSDSITQIQLQQNRIENLKKGRILPKLAKNLIKLDLSNNRIRTIEAGAFDDFDKLQVLYLRSNFLRFRNMVGVFTSTLDNLHQLDLGYNNLEKANGFFDKLGNLQKLILDGNKKLKLTEDFFGKGLENLEVLSLDDCGLTYLNETLFDNLPKLRALSLRNNPLTHIPKAVDKLKKLTHLDMSGTLITEIDKAMISDDSSLQVILFKDLPYLSMITDCAFCGLQNLSEVDFSNCSQLHTISDNAFGSVSKDKQIPDKLKKVHFGACNLTTFQQDLLNWDDLEEIDISGNPLVCDCKLKWLIEDSTKQTFKGNTTAKCAAPENVRNMTLNKVNDLVCPQSRVGRVFFFSFVFFVLVVAAIFGFIYYTRRRGRLTNIFYRPEMPDMGYNNLNTNSNIMDEGYTYSLNQERQEEDI